MYHSTSDAIQSTLLSFMMKLDAPGLWDHLKKIYFKKDDLHYINQVLKDFQNNWYNPPNNIINAFTSRLRAAQVKLADTDVKLSNATLH